MNNIIKSLRLNRWLLFRSEMDRMLMISMTFSVLMTIVRMIYTGSITYAFLAWNLFLAYLPYALTSWLQEQPVWRDNKKRFGFIFLVWLVLIPNSFYIVTDLFHLQGYYGVPLWFDLAMILSFAWNGLLLGILSVWQMEKRVQALFGSKNEWLFLGSVMLLNALGIYIGRYLRFNSWDIITNPLGLMLEILEMLIHPVRYIYAWGMIGCFSIFMTLIYLTIKRTAKAFRV